MRGTDTEWESAHKVNSGEDKFSHCSCRDSNSQTFDHESAILTNKLSRSHWLCNFWFTITENACSSSCTEDRSWAGRSWKLAEAALHFMVQCKKILSYFIAALQCNINDNNNKVSYLHFSITNVSHSCPYSRQLHFLKRREVFQKRKI